jgi:hypothetical protein
MNIREANLVLIKRYLKIAKKSNSMHSLKLIALCEFILENPDVYIDRLNRWVGFIQGVLFAEGEIDLVEERDFARTLYSKYYNETKNDMSPGLDEVL